jgi:hypothetical protein
MPTKSQARTTQGGTAGLLLPWEVGGFFEHSGLPHGETNPWPQPSVFFALARHVVPGILRVNKSIRRLWVPEYFCPDVTRYWSEIIETTFYLDDPGRREPDWKSLQPDKNDLVVAMNYFGMRERESWEHQRSSRDYFLLEDHTHDPLSAWALTSTADYVFSSLRKSMPITDGAICWSPRGRHLPLPQGIIDAHGIDLKLNAMLEKANFLAGGALPETKAHYRESYAKGDKYLEEGPESPISNRALEYVRSGIPVGWRKIRERNARTLLSGLKETEATKPLFVQWPAKSVPFAVVLVFGSTSDRDNCRSYLEMNNVFCPIHWASDRFSSASDLSARILSIPADQRYSDEDMAKVAMILNQWGKTKPDN